MAQRLDTFRVFASLPGERTLKLVGIYANFSAAKDRAEYIHVTRPDVRCRIRVPKGQGNKWANQSFASTYGMSLFPRYARYSEEGPRWTFLSEKEMMCSINSVYMV